MDPDPRTRFITRYAGMGPFCDFTRFFDGRVT
jgi:hypothetical protein